ncbi:hypothetical protein L228DRAFT_237422 [Xylona heveae TC161]|uniref:BZIP domain-containing protein n=1 Tax=Xylona heveae (strain CBS 132557 / TC161) TaxID=1328760 RepID=A0A165I7I4_XYLHT|nr:hypothetical protein L228DRAFT_237422 [Xylona heveae TC161]KZF24498.1 hypothetical protein L228DRAFT_237422 [Xylona heveae TC161]
MPSDLETRLQHGHGAVDDWTRTEDKDLRKRIQNRLAQRKRREKLAQTHFRAKRRNRAVGREEADGDSSSASPSEVIETINPQRIVSSWNKNDSVGLKIQNMIVATGLAEHRFIRLAQYSLLRAFVSNAAILGLSPALLADDESISPWTISNPFKPAEYATEYPHTLRPTHIQLSTYHHPYIDLIASPNFRDNILLAMLTDEQEDQFCHDFSSDAVKIWGSQPWNPTGWEISQEFLDRWSSLIDEGTIRTSNFWRLERGERPLALPAPSTTSETDNQLIATETF